MSGLRVRPNGDHGLVTEVTPESAGWNYVGFALDRLAAGETLEAETGARENCLVLVSGKAKLTIDGKTRRDFPWRGGCGRTPRPPPRRSPAEE